MWAESKPGVGSTFHFRLPVEIVPQHGRQERLARCRDARLPSSRHRRRKDAFGMSGCEEQGASVMLMDHADGLQMLQDGLDLGL